MLPLRHRSGAAAIFTLGECARRSVIAARLLIEWGGNIVDSTEITRKTDRLGWIAGRLKRLRRPHIEDPDLEQELDQLVDAIMYDSRLADVAGVFLDVKQRWQATGPQLSELLDELAQKVESDAEPGASELWNLRHTFQREHYRLTADDLNWSKREALIKSMVLTAEKSPWTSSADWLRREYSSFQGGQRLAIQDVLGFVAQGEKGVVETKAFQRYRAFFDDLSQGSVSDEALHAGKWLERLGEVDTLPGAPE